MKNKRTESLCVYVLWDTVGELANPVIDAVVIADKDKGLSIVTLEDVYSASGILSGPVFAETGDVMFCMPAPYKRYNKKGKKNWDTIVCGSVDGVVFHQVGDYLYSTERINASCQFR